MSMPDDLEATNAPDVRSVAFLDWHKHPVGPRRQCRYCGKGALMRDDNGRPCHKVCAEAELAAKAEAYGKAEAA